MGPAMNLYVGYVIRQAGGIGKKSLTWADKSCGGDHVNFKHHVVRSRSMFSVGGFVFFQKGSNSATEVCSCSRVWAPSSFRTIPCTVGREDRSYKHFVSPMAQNVARQCGFLFRLSSLDKTYKTKIQWMEICIPWKLKIRNVYFPFEVSYWRKKIESLHIYLKAFTLKTKWCHILYQLVKQIPEDFFLPTFDGWFWTKHPFIFWKDFVDSFFLFWGRFKSFIANQRQFQM